MTATGRRFAIYYAPPPDGALARFGNRWLGRSATTGRPWKQPTVPGLDARRLREITATPRRYGLHATLKPPFALARGFEAAELYAAVAAFAGARRSFPMPQLAPGVLGGFLALRPAAACAALDRLAADCVRAFDRFRAPAAEVELARRRTGLTRSQEAMLAAWGYPYVLDEFRFHFALTGRLEPAERRRVLRALAPLAAPACAGPQPVEEICVFAQRDRAAPFRIVGRFAFASAAELSGRR